MMCTLILISVWTCFSGMAGGGDFGTVIGIAHFTMTGGGVTTAAFQSSISMSIQVGEDTTETMIGMDTGGNMKGFLTENFNTAGGAGIMIDIGKDKEPGAFRAIILEHKTKGRN